MQGGGNLPLTTAEIGLSVTRLQGSVGWMTDCFHWTDEAFVPLSTRVPAFGFFSSFQVNGLRQNVLSDTCDSNLSPIMQINEEFYLYVVTAAPRAQTKTHFLGWFCSDLYRSEVFPGTGTCQTDRHLWKFSLFFAIEVQSEWHIKCRANH